MLKVTADQINLSNITKFQTKMQDMIDSCDHILSLEVPEMEKREAVAAMLNGMGAQYET